MRIRELRLERGWSQEHLAERSGLSVRTIQRIENGHAAGLATTTALAATFGVGADQLLGAAPTPAPSGPPDPFRSAVRAGLIGYANFHGSTRRSEYWWFVAFVLLVASAGMLLDPLVGALAVLGAMLPLLAASTRRLRDAGHSGWWQLLHLVPFGGVVPLILLTRPSVAEPPTSASA